MTNPDDFKTESYDYELPDDLIAAFPAEKRDNSRLMMIDKQSGKLHKELHFYDILDELDESHFLVVNNTKVLPARLMGERLPTRGKCEVLLLEPQEYRSSQKAVWSAMTKPAKKLTTGTEIDFGTGLTGKIVDEKPEGVRLIEFSTEKDFRSALDEVGTMPLPPYILAKRGEKVSRDSDRERYQTIFAQSEGSVAAPTAALHFTDELKSKLQSKGIEIIEITLHVGAGTFKPITADSIEEHPMHEEFFEISNESAEKIEGLKKEGRRLVSVGTTSTRALEAATQSDGTLQRGKQSTSLMIAPGYEWKIIDGLITNFHLPKSSLLCLVSALIGRQNVLDVYRHAVENKYRFYSYGDSMLIL